MTTEFVSAMSRVEGWRLLPLHNRWPAQPHEAISRVVPALTALFLVDHALTDALLTTLADHCPALTDMAIGSVQLGTSHEHRVVGWRRVLVDHSSRVDEVQYRRLPQPRSAPCMVHGLVRYAVLPRITLTDAEVRRQHMHTRCFLKVHVRGHAWTQLQLWHNGLKCSHARSSPVREGPCMGSYAFRRRNISVA